MSEFDVTVGVVAWNAAEHLAALLASLPAALGDLNGQVVVIDNGSADKTREVLAAHQWVEAVTNVRNLGLTPGRNQILDRHRGRHICMLDADTIPEPRSIETLVHYIEANARIGLAGAKLLNLDGTVQESCRTFPPLLLPVLRRGPMGRLFEHRRTVNRHYMRDYDHATPRPVHWVMGACQCYPSALLPRLGRYDERIFSHGGEDLDWCMRIWRTGLEVHYVPDARMTHAYGHYTRRKPLSKQSFRAATDYWGMLYRNRDARTILPPP